MTELGISDTKRRAAVEGIVVRKYGGSSLATPELVRGVAARIAELAAAGRSVVVVVSAMGDATDRLVALAGQFADRPDPRELDQLLATGEQVSAAVLALALTRRGVDAVSLTGDQAGIEVTGEAGAGTIAAIDPERILDGLRAGRVVVVAGFQGRDADGELRTLGRGGSDTTAVALAAALGAAECEICTDVPGVRTADPRIVPDTRPVPSVSYEAMAEFARGGARVLHPRSVELAGRHGVTVRVRHSSRTGPSTRVHAAEPALERGAEVIGIAHDRDVRLLRIGASRLSPDRGARLLAGLAGHGLHPDTLSWPGDGELRFTLRGTAPFAGPARELVDELGAPWTVDDDLGALSVIGTGLLGRPDMPAEVLRTAGELGATVPAMAVSAGRLTAVLPLDRLDVAVRALHRSFHLDLPPEARP
ncbi:aspartate kinase [Amycolatopsis sp. NPDC021455]|uniref:aspartate kinase n=1 Tax=Amycolatopsis sp. NPDC021455 TaxID=3154901 RepID=UPI0033C42F0F